VVRTIPELEREQKRVEGRMILKLNNNNNNNNNNKPPLSLCSLPPYSPPSLHVPVIDRQEGFPKPITGEIGCSDWSEVSRELS